MKRDEDDEPSYEVRLMASGRVNLSEIAENSFNEAQKIIEAYNVEELENPELKLRSALDMLLNVFWIKKDLRIPISRQMHSIGKVLHENYGCAFGFENGFYYTKCPNMLLHRDFGFSMRGFEKYKCSICNIDPVDCIHRTGRKYNNIECKEFDGRCNICCNEISSCGHHLGEAYDNVEAIKVVYDMQIITFDVVKEPDFALARVTKIPFSKQYIIKSIGKDLHSSEFIYGITVLNCDHCISCAVYNPDANGDFWVTP
ncbi:MULTISPECIES: hypothetical protein [Klebsiella]|uniref:hypothetical protein n=1 Tax=Klebsiella TaxID=570 RepID=UPI000CEC7054|nr:MULTISPECIES: hypothetical protein [Klebsiella]HBR2078949.1 hypothetical protein [Klebsiella quasipneumoniae subsp. quasipneumoniae]MCV6914785.1 hypothetical protein [Klebsiella pneumoniae]MDE9343755.1 hypothetical protein [Klebsiella variicola]MDG0763864.1 hypothetical protein [Klebsiella quasipneumoniae]PPJ88519.1 hypothetical protein CSC93_05840 [Klebsiella pneumoniae]